MSTDPAPVTAGACTVAVGDGVELEAEAFLPVDPVAAMVITHPHPTHGGSMHTPIPTLLYQESRRLGVAAVRFNFRGVGRSSGTYDEGVGERLDVRAVVASLRAAIGPEPALGVGGWSFGADVALGVGADTIAGWFAVAAPLSVVPVDEMAASDSRLPKHLVVPELDQFRAPAAARELTASWANTSLTVVEHNDHFLASGLPDVAAAYAAFIAAITTG